MTRSAWCFSGVMIFAFVWMACGSHAKGDEPAADAEARLSAPDRLQSTLTERSTCGDYRQRLQTLSLPVTRSEFWDRMGLPGAPDSALRSLNCFSGYCTVSTFLFDFTEDCSLQVVEEGWEDEVELSVTQASLTDRDAVKTPQDSIPELQDNNTPSL
ncbi:MAG: hypothetical protein MPN21_01900 [Thermoanaerobaculia bacterium]|nr:hypothetical protein [Thermoanaerobaculia bacterium]